MDFSTQTMADDAKSMSDLFELVEKLTIQLNEKDKELATNKQNNEKLQIELHAKDQELKKKDEELAKEQQEKQKMSSDLDKEKARANRANKLESELAISHETNVALQQSLWKSFPFPGLCYYIKTQSGLQNGQFHYLYNESGNLRSSTNDWSRSEFKFTKNTDGTFSIYTTMGKYLQTNIYSPRVGFTGIKDGAEKFVLFFHQQNQQPGISVDISTLAGSFLCMNKDNFVVANSSNAPANKFLIIPVGVQRGNSSCGVQ